MKHTPSGIYWPSIVDPPAGTVRARLVTKGGYIRRDSSMTAAKYVRLAAPRNVMSVSLSKVDRISAMSWRMASGWVHK